MSIQTCLAAALLIAAPETGLAAASAQAQAQAQVAPPESPAATQAQPCIETSGPEADSSRRSLYRPMDEFSPHHHRRLRGRSVTVTARSGRSRRRSHPRSGLRRFRGVTLGLGGRLVVGRYQPDIFDEPSTAPRRYGAAGTPVVDALAEFGARRLRFVIGTIVAPVPIGFSDYWTSTLFGVRAGFLAGNERYRFGATAGGGVWFTWAVMAHAFITPWRDRWGSRHGIGVDAGLWNFLPALTLSYRVAPAAWNHVGGRRAAMKRAELRSRP